MPPLRFALLLVGVVAAAGLTLALASWLGGALGTGLAALLLPLTLVLALVLRRRRP